MLTNPPCLSGPLTYTALSLGSTDVRPWTELKLGHMFALRVLQSDGGLDEDDAGMLRGRILSPSLSLNVPYKRSSTLASSGINSPLLL